VADVKKKTSQQKKNQTQTKKNPQQKKPTQTPQKNQKKTGWGIKRGALSKRKSEGE